jgi:thiamine biosynthesis lipoprotein
VSDRRLSRHVELVMGTAVSFLLDEGDLDYERLLEALDGARGELHRLDELFSTWREESPMSRYRRGELPATELPDEISEVLTLCQQVKALSGGYFDPWALEGGIDPSGLSKGWIVERAAEALQKNGVSAGVVSGGGDVVTFGPPPEGSFWQIGVQHPWRRDRLACLVDVPPGGAIATSGRYERGDHLFNPFTGAPAQTGLVSVSVTGPSLVLADGLATAVGAAEPDPISLVRKLPSGYEAYLIFEDGSEEATPGFSFVGAADDQPTEEKNSPLFS